MYMALPCFFMPECGKLLIVGTDSMATAWKRIFFPVKKAPHTKAYIYVVAFLRSSHGNGYT